jgi:5-methyltetrahydropteroyltriglutamate--homocysteine methyltransferase
MLYDRANTGNVDEAAFQNRVTEAVNEIVRKQLDSGVDIVNDGEQGKVSYYSYVQERLTGFGGEGKGISGADLHAFPEYMARMYAGRASYTIKRGSCVGPIEFRDRAGLETDLENFKAALEGVDPSDRFMSSASPGIISVFLVNNYYPTHAEYIHALAAAMKNEYDAIHQAGFILQIDCPDLALGRNTAYRDESLEKFREVAELHVEALNEATRDIPPEAMRMHLCWGNYEGPHHLDVPFRDIIDIVLKARPAGISFEGANPRHEHEWAMWEDVKLPEGKVLIPGVLDSTTNFIEHPELVAQRIQRYANLVGRENVIAGSDCGFSTGAGFGSVDPRIVWAKLGAMAEGAAIASKKLWQ